ncbi:hypothetical protein PT2222_150308 [Paraburkholderia tropica]
MTVRFPETRVMFESLGTSPGLKSGRDNEQDSCKRPGKSGQNEAEPESVLRRVRGECP